LHPYAFCIVSDAAALHLFQLLDKIKIKTFFVIDDTIAV